MQTINLLPRDYLKRQRNKTYKGIAMSVIAIELAIACLIAVVPIGQILRKEEILQEINEKLENPRFEEVIAVNSQLGNIKEDYNKLSVNFDQIKDSAFIGGGMLDILVSNLPVGVSIDRLQLDSNHKTIEIQGKTVNSFSITGYVSKLENFYKNASLNFNQEKVQDGVSYRKFSISIELQDSLEIQSLDREELDEQFN